MATKIVCVEGIGNTSGVFDFESDALTNYARNIAAPNTNGFAGMRLSANNTYAIAGTSTSEALYAGLWADGAAVTWGAGTSCGTDAPYIIPHPTDETIFASVGAIANSFAVYQIDANDLSITLLDSVGVTGVSSFGNGASWNADGTRVCFGTSTRIYLYSWNGSALAALDDIAMFAGGADRAQPNFVPETNLIFVGCDNHTQVRLVDYTGDTLTITDTTTPPSTAFTRSCVSPNGLYALQCGRPGVDVSSIWPINSDGTFGTEIQFPDGHNEAVWIGNDRIVAIEDTNFSFMSVYVYSFDGSTITELASDASNVPNAQRAYITATSQTAPPTVQVQFETTYADVSGRDPLPTALQNRTAALNLVNYLVGIYAGNNPRIVKKPVLIDQGELSKVSPAPPAGKLCREIWIKDPRDPNFKTGRRAVILGRAGGVEPGTVELTLFIADNAESLVEPT